MSEPKQIDYGVLGLFAGVGGIEMGFRNAGFPVIIANEIDEFASSTYRENHKHPLITGSISDLTVAEISRSVDPAKIKVITGGFPCQPFSVAGNRLGFEDDRGNLFWEIHRLIYDLEPEVIFLENVKNLQGHDSGKTYKKIKGALEGREASPDGTLLTGYTVDERIYNSSDFGIPQNRERIYIVAFKDPKLSDFFSWPEGRQANRRLAPVSDFIDPNLKVDKKYHYEGNAIYDKLEAAMGNVDTFYQWRRHYVRENKSGVCPTLTANMGTGGHNVPLVRTPHGIRKLTPKECFALMGMKDIKFPSDKPLADSRLYKQAGNAVVVPVITEIALAIRQALIRRDSPRLEVLEK